MFGSNRDFIVRYVLAISTHLVSLGGGGGQPGPASANDVLLQGLKAERDALKQALKSVQGELQRYAKENATLENELERALFEVEKLTPID